MRGDRIPDEDHVARYCGPKHIADGKVDASAFRLRPNEEYVSVNWLEFLNCLDRESELTELRRIYSAKPLKLSNKGRMAILNVGKVCEKVCRESPDKRNLDVLHNPGPNDPSHSGIYNLRQDDVWIAELIRQAIQETHPALPEIEDSQRLSGRSGLSN
jgi:hypothetical protein